jgi:hypothetical protein
VPEISGFLGIVIRMYYRDYAPPHFHAVYRDYEVTVEIETGSIRGTFPRRALNAVLEWHKIHREELVEDWELARQELPLRDIEPLE